MTRQASGTKGNSGKGDGNGYTGTRWPTRHGCRTSDHRSHSGRRHATCREHPADTAPERTAGLSGGGGGGAASGGDNRGAGGGIPPRGERRFVADEITAFSASATPQAIEQLARRYNLTQLEGSTFRCSAASSPAGASRPRSLGRSRRRDRGRAHRRQRPAQLSLHAAGGCGEGDADRPQRRRAIRSRQAGGRTSASGRDREKHPGGRDQFRDRRETSESGWHDREELDALGGEDNPPQHGTAIAGAIAAHGKLLGIAPGVRLLAARAFDDTPSPKAPPLPSTKACNRPPTAAPASSI